MKTNVVTIIFSILFVSSITSTGLQAGDGLQGLTAPQSVTVFPDGFPSVNKGIEKQPESMNKGMEKQTEVRRKDPVVIERTSPILKRMTPQLNQKYLQNLKNAQSSLASGETTKATEYFNEALQMADTAELKSETKLVWANVVSHEARNKGNDPALQRQAADLYSKSLPDLKGESRLLGYNNYGSLLLRMNNSKEALKTLVSIKADYAKEPNSKKRSRFLYNLARAYEENGDRVTANSHFLETAQIDPSFSPASKAVIRSTPYIKVSPIVIQDTMKWLNAIVEKGDLKVSDQGLQMVLSQKAWRSEPEFESIMLPLIRYLTITATGPDAFQSVWLNRLSISDLDSELVKLIKKEIICVYEGRFPVAFRSAINRNMVQALLSLEEKYNERGIVSAFIKMIGDSFLANNQYDFALQRYALALNVDNNNTEAALNASTILLNHSKDINNSVELTKQLIGTLFHGKGEAYLGEDWENILRFHMVLGAIFTRQECWGNEYNPYSAIFQLEHAIKAHDQLLKQRPEGKWRIAGVKFALAGVFLNASTSGPGSLGGTSTTNTYVDAAKTAMIEKDNKLAKDIVRSLREHHLILNEKQQAIIKDVENFIEADKHT